MNPAYHNIRFRAGLPKAGLPVAFGIVIACNPEGRKVTNRENRQGVEALRSALAAERHFFFPVTGGSRDFSHAEPGFGVLFEAAKEAVSWGRRFRQDGVYWVEEGIVHLVPCDGAAPVDLGEWQILAEPAAQKPIFRFLGTPYLLNLPSRLPPEWRSPIDEGRMLVLSPFAPNESRVTANLASRRNEYVARLADEVWIAHASDGGKLQKSLRSPTS